MPATKSTEKLETHKCGECLMNDVEIVALGPDGKCPRCGADYGRDRQSALSCGCDPGEGYTCAQHRGTDGTR